MELTGPCALNADDQSTNNGCQVSSTITIVGGPGPSVAVNMEGNFSPNTMTVECSLTPTCLQTPGQTAISGSPVSWNKFSASSPDVVWIHVYIGTPSNLSTTQPTSVQFTGVTFVLNGTTYKLPDGFLYFDPSYTGSPTTVFDPLFANANGIPGAWTTTLNPNHLPDEIFDGAALPVDSNITGGGGATFSYTTLSSDANLKWSWQWSAAAYTFWPSNWNAAEILAYHNSDHAGTPENMQVQHSLIQGPRGGGGSNYTGSWSGTGQGTCTNNFEYPLLSKLAFERRRWNSATVCVERREP